MESKDLFKQLRHYTYCAFSIIGFNLGILVVFIYNLLKYHNLIIFMQGIRNIYINLAQGNTITLIVLARYTSFIYLFINLILFLILNYLTKKYYYRISNLYQLLVSSLIVLIFSINVMILVNKVF